MFLFEWFPGVGHGPDDAHCQRQEHHGVEEAEENDESEHLKIF